MNDETAIALRPVNPELLIAQAIEKNVSVETMERLLAMRRELKAEAAKEAFDRALAAFQADCPTIQKTKAVVINGAVRYRYAPLEDVVSQVKALLQHHGFSYTLDALVEEGWVTATCELTHSLGHSKKSSFKVPIEAGAKMGEAQKFASALTFSKRYSFVNSLGIMTSDEDDDSRAAQENHPHAQPASKPQANPAPKQPVRKANELPALLEAAKAKFIANLTAEKKLFDGWVYCVETGVILDTETLEDARVEALWPCVTNGEVEVNETFRAALKRDYDHMMADIRAHTILADNVLKWTNLFEAAYNEQKKPIEVPREPNAPRGEPFWGIICPVPRKGMKRDEYLKHPDTIQSLYDAAKDGIEEAGKRLFGFAYHWQPEPRESGGKTYQPTAQDHAFREALDDFLEWRKAHGDKLGDEMREAIQ